MAYYIGIDLGTSAVKITAISDGGEQISASEGYEVVITEGGGCEQNPEEWYEKTMAALKTVLKTADPEEVKAIGFSGQMHGLVMLDANDRPIRPAMLWNDGRATEEVEYLNDIVGTEKLLKNTANIAFAGFTAPKLLWVKRHERDNFNRAAKIMLPKDYLAYRMTGKFATDVSDASGTLYFDVRNKRWSKEMLSLTGISEDILPEVYGSTECIGTVKPDLAKELGLSDAVKVIIGAGDNAASAFGAGCFGNGDCNISLGTSGTVFVCADNCLPVGNGAIHTFCSASGGYHYLACILSAASCQKWWIEDVLKTDYSSAGGLNANGSNEVYFLPYLTGERSPVNDSRAKGLFFGITGSTTREDMTLAVLEGVAFALKQNVEIIKKAGVEIKKAGVCGGGAKNKLWIKLLADVLDIEIALPLSEQGASVGAALMALKGSESGQTFDRIAKEFFRAGERILPDKEIAGRYGRRYRTYLKLYPAFRSLQSSL